MTQPAASGRLALVTGASRGLGFAMAAALGAKGFHVLAVARNQGGLEELDDRIKSQGGSATLAPMDLSDPKAVEHLAASVAARWGGLDLWVHTAVHAAPLTPTAHIDARDLAKSLSGNITATAGLIAALSPLLGARRGTALFFDDPRAGQKFFGSYGASKAAQMALVRSWQTETLRVGPRVLIETPQPMATATRARFFPGEDRTPLATPEAEAARILSHIAPIILA